MIQEIIVVEGKDDTAAIRRAVDAETIETGGSAINEAIYRRIALARERRGVIIFTDPDHAGERLRRLIAARVPGCKMAFLSQEEATDGKGDIGIEHASPELIRKALREVKTDFERTDSHISWDDLVAAGLIVHPEASSRRARMGLLLGIGHANGKQFYKRCRMFQISREEFAEAYKQLISEGHE
ncbi:ribonuclease M5 [Paenibacillus cymbidii]|uniref:ribonuclease M5 n=1 Tax=Paenibacillus cymbidii TaxID=1639034 RepID=UPI00107FFE7F|nr:ribonuclease M5 [Paenibacillus cymbidii]